MERYTTTNQMKDSGEAFLKVFEQAPQTVIILGATLLVALLAKILSPRRPYKVYHEKPRKTAPQNLIAASQQTAKATATGEKGEEIIRHQLSLSLNPRDYEAIHDVLIPNGYGQFTQIDHVVISIYGIFVIETKNMAGLIEGRETDREWLQCFPNQRPKKFHNPIEQNRGHIMALAHLLGIDAPIYHNVVVFVGKAKFQTWPLMHVHKLTDYLPQILQWRHPVMPEEQMRRLAYDLRLKNQAQNQALRSAHQARLQHQFAA